MDYIETRPPISRADIEDLLTKVESVKTQAIDRAVLSNLVRICHECLLKKGELIKLSVRDVAKRGVVGDVMQVGEDKVILSGPAKQMLQNHIDYLKKNGYRLYPTNPLFPSKKKMPYTKKTLDNHLKEAQNVEINST